MTYTVTDLFAGAGGSSTGMVNTGLRVVIAANHSELAVRTHQVNHPETDHDLADISQVDFRRYPKTDFLWASPECTNHSIAKGKRRVTGQGDLFGTDEDDVAIRSRATMFDVPRALEAGVLRGRPYIGGVVENVVDATEWMYWDSWIRMFDAAGYHVRPVFLNSMHARDDRAVPAPQSRDRLYVVFWLKKLGRSPNLNITLPAWCPRCETAVDAVQSWRRPDRMYGKHRQQYDYACPNLRCRVVVEPAVRAAAEVIDWSELGSRIGDRTRPLAAATIARIEAGLRKFARPMLAPAGGTWNDGASPVDDPFRTRTTRETEGLACPPMLIPTESRAEPDRVASAFGPMRTQTARQDLALAVPAGFVMRNNTPRGGNEKAAGLCTPFNEPVRTITTAGHQSVVTMPGQHLLMAYYGNGTCTPVTRPVPTQPTGERFALVGGQVQVEDCTFRMLQPKEIAGAMAFPEGYILLGAKRDKVKLLGNAVTPPAAELLMRRLVDMVEAAA
ncbi:DNA cytosine methyltransferase [Frankia sp. AgW1.1]|uniref:DNA cytosine methyltransferase n=1 Tax=Frankia sp. AgW1.1 TaxID=1836971 RepID=UPI0019312F49|nr:DNA cytosine methyltransferase [Frankia sp. AgW1.1]MBL7487041.1 DNA cytosine methyltransferase [Frankia sp. AgW1.1]